MNTTIPPLFCIAAIGLFWLPREASAQTVSQAQTPSRVAAAPAPAAPAPVTPTASDTAIAPAPSPVAVVEPATAPPPPAPQPVALTGAPPAVPPPGYVLVPIGAGYPLAPAPVEEEAKRNREYPYETGQKVPFGYHVEERVRKGLVISGAITLGVPWLISTSTALEGDNDGFESGYLVIPVLGPWLALATSDKRHCEYGYCSDNADVRAALFLDGIVQATGAILLTTGLVYPRRVLVKDIATVSFTPTTVDRDGYGFGVVGTF